MATPPPSTVAFPSASTDSPTTAKLPHGPSFRPFRRISVPTTPPPSILQIHRQSVGSVGSFDSLAGEGSPGSSYKQTHRMSTSIESPSPRRRRRSNLGIMKPVVLDQTKEAKRRKIVDEFVETERTYLDGLELIYEHFLTPLIASLDMSSASSSSATPPTPILDRPSLTAVFSNFIDIWNLHRAFYASLSSISFEASSVPALCSTLASHFPYLSLYSPFTTAFPTALTTLSALTTQTSPSYNPTFSSFLASREADSRCGRFKLRDWLLTIIQRCPRYLLLLKDLIVFTDPESPEYEELVQVQALVTKITEALNTSIQTHAETLALLALQRSTSSLPASLQFISPGRALIQRESLKMLDPTTGGMPAPREILLFVDILVWLEPADASSGGWDFASSLGFGSWIREPTTPTRRRTRSDAASAGGSVLRSTPIAIPGAANSPGARRSYHLPASASAAVGAGGEEKRWVYKGHVGLVDATVVGGVDSPIEQSELTWKFEVLSPQGSFLLFADSAASRTAWTTAIRTAKSELLVNLGLMRPHSTLASSASSAHVRKSVRAVAFLPDDEGVELVDRAVLGDTSPPPTPAALRTDGKVKRREVDHFVPAAWMPDDRAAACVRCGRLFGWIRARRRHHCRLCGGVVCSSCSGKTFFISEMEEHDHAGMASPLKLQMRHQKKQKQKYKPARACETCYEAVFPVIDDASSSSAAVSSKPAVGASSPIKMTFTSSSSPPRSPAGSNHGAASPIKVRIECDKDTITSLRDLPMWVSVPSTGSTPTSSRLLGGSGAAAGEVGVSRMSVGVGVGATVDRRGRRKSGSAGSAHSFGTGYSWLGRPRSHVSIDLLEDHMMLEEPEEGEEQSVGGGGGVSLSAVSVLERERGFLPRRIKRPSLPAGAALQRTSVLFSSPGTSALGSPNASLSNLSSSPGAKEKG